MIKLFHKCARDDRGLRRRTCSLIVLLFAALHGCAPTPAWERAGALPVDDAGVSAVDAMSRSGGEAAARRWTGGVSALGSDRPGLPNAGLQLPRVSPSGRWVAYLDVDRQVEPVAADALVTGRGLGGVSLWLRRVESDGLARNIAAGDATWPTWSPDSRRLYFISHESGGGCALAWHDVASAQTRRLAVGINRMLMPAASPDGRRVAVAGYGQVADQAVIFLIDLETGRATPGPPPTLGGAQLAPRWLDRDTLVFVELDDHGGGLMRWTPGSPTAVPVGPLELPASVFDAVHLDAGLADPLSPDRRWYTYYATGEDRLGFVDLAEGTTRWSEAGHRAGRWWDGGWFLAGDDIGLSLMEVDAPADAAGGSGGVGAASAGETSGGEMPRMTLLPGRWAPRWADPVEGTMLLIGQGETADRFRLLQLWVKVRR